MAGLHVARFNSWQGFVKYTCRTQKIRLDFFILASPLDKGMQPINYKSVNWLIYCDQEPLWLLTRRR